MRRHARALMELTLIAGLATLLTLAAAVAPAQAGPEAATTQSVDISNFAFNPGTIKIAVGTRVTWTNSDSAPHTVTADAGEFDSGRLQPGATFEYTFDAIGTFAYHCALHASMHGTVEVVEAGSAELTQPVAKAPAAKARQEPRPKQRLRPAGLWNAGLQQLRRVRHECIPNALLRVLQQALLRAAIPRRPTVLLPVPSRVQTVLPSVHPAVLRPLLVASRSDHGQARSPGIDRGFSLA